MRSIVLALVLALSVFSTPAFADNFDITCQTLGQVGRCESVPFCRPENRGLCVPNAAKRGNAEWIEACKSMGPAERFCEDQAFCEWQSVIMCVPTNR